DEKIIAGISSGLAAYFSMEIWITRLLIILISIIITPPAAILIYILLWIIVPEAKTTAQKLEMKGENITVSNIEKTIKEEVNNVKNNFKRFAKSDSYKKAKTVINKSADATSVFLEAFGKIILAIIGIIFIIIGSISILSLGTILIFDFSVFPISFSEGSIFITQYAHLFASPTNATILLLGIFLITITPLFLLLFAGLKFTFNFKSNNKLILLISLFAWIIGIFITISFSLLEVRNYAIKENIRQGESTYSSKYTCFILETSSQNYNNNYLNILEKDNQRTLQIRPSIDIKRSYNDSIQVIVTKKSRGRNKRNADNNAKQLIYNWEIKDSVIIFDPYFQIQAGNQWRFSEIDIIVKIPKDQKIYISENTEELLENISNNRNYQKNRMGNKFWRMKNDELHYVKKP
ncbi:MAG: PspC domain-containing protein, partial [Bacteroidales bacterium]|nr:PspC domain-containing protein [Bacteroidales bacterium]